jgi:hypothetical protein
MHRIELIEGPFKQSGSADALLFSLMENAIEYLRAWGVAFGRYSVSDPLFEQNHQICGILAKLGESALPITIVDGQVAKTGEYPTSDELIAFSGIEEENNCEHCEGCDCGCENGESCDCGGKNREGCGCGSVRHHHQ